MNLSKWSHDCNSGSCDFMYMVHMCQPCTWPSFQVECLDWDADGSHDLIGTYNTTLAEIKVGHTSWHGHTHQVCHSLWCATPDSFTSLILCCHLEWTGQEVGVSPSYQEEEEEELWPDQDTVSEGTAAGISYHILTDYFLTYLGEYYLLFSWLHHGRVSNQLYSGCWLHR